MWCNKYVVYLKTMGYWETVLSTLKFVAHVMFVILMLFVGAMVFADIEDPVVENTSESEEFMNILPETLVQEFRHLHSNYSNNRAHFWAQLKFKYSLPIREKSETQIMDDMKMFLEYEGTQEESKAYQDKIQDRGFVIMKWFYFLTIASSTVGYGDIAPQTENGRLFYIFFSWLGIGLMMSLLVRCGDVVTTANKRFFVFIKNRLCSGSMGGLSEELLSVISVICIFVLFLYVGWWHRKAVKDSSVSTISFIYYWIVSFTTVGFGDLYLFTLEEEIQNIYVLLVYRMFGLSFVSGIIASIEAYTEMKQKEMQRKTKILTETRKALLDRKLSVMSDCTTYPKFAIDRKLPQSNMNTLEKNSGDKAGNSGIPNNMTTLERRLKRYPEDYIDNSPV